MAAPDVTAVLDPSAPAQFEALLSGMQNNVNETRAACEELFTRCKAHPEPLVACLVRCLRTSADAQLRSIAAVLLRKVRAGGQRCGAEG
jgi:hypothetical protein